MPFSGVDYYAIDELLSDDERIVRDTFRRFVDDEVMPTIGQHFRAGTSIFCVTEATPIAGRGLDVNSMSTLHQFQRSGRGEGHPVFIIFNFFGYSNDHNTDV